MSNIDEKSKKCLTIDSIYYKDIINLYIKKKWSLRMIAEKYNTNHHRIKRILVHNNIRIKRHKIKREVSLESRKKMSESHLKLKSKGIRPYNYGKKAPKELVYKNMRAHLKYKVDLEWLLTFTDIEKLKFLNRSISRDRTCRNFNSLIYIKFIEKFYYDPQFNKIYQRWLLNKDSYLMPSLDHIVPKSKGGSLTDLNNLQYLTWFENRAKNNLTQKDWLNIKKNIHKYLS